MFESLNNLYMISFFTTCINEGVILQTFKHSNFQTINLQPSNSPNSACICRGSGGFGRVPVESSHSRPARTRSQNIEKHTVFETCGSETQKNTWFFATGGWCAAQKPRKTFGFSMFFMISSLRLFPHISRRISP